MEAQTTKPLNLIDAIVLVAATAVGLALGRSANAYRGDDSINEVVARYVVSVALMWTLTIFALNLTRHRTTLRGLACRPGFTAMLAIVVDWTFRSIGSAICFNFGAYGGTFPFGSIESGLQAIFETNFYWVVHDASNAVLVTVVWLVSAMAGCWHAEKTWIDRTGRSLGVFWLLAVVAYWLSQWVIPSPP